MQFGENAKWVVAEIRPVSGQTALFLAPKTLELPWGFAGEIIWHVYTPDWDLVSIVFPPGSTFSGNPQPDPNRPGCWSTVATNNTVAGSTSSFSYTISVRNRTTGETASWDPAVQNEAPPTA
ncbi:MAG TPA: hypothetical protein VF618_04515 [Thermoanaerobaculia bacterium]